MIDTTDRTHATYMTDTTDNDGHVGQDKDDGHDNGRKCNLVTLTALTIRVIAYTCNYLMNSATQSWTDTNNVHV